MGCMEGIDGLLGEVQAVGARFALAVGLIRPCGRGSVFHFDLGDLRSRGIEYFCPMFPEIFDVLRGFGSTACGTFEYMGNMHIRNGWLEVFEGSL